MAKWTCWACRLDKLGAEKKYCRGLGRAGPADRCEACYRKDRTRGKCVVCKKRNEFCVMRKDRLRCFRKCHHHLELLRGRIGEHDFDNCDEADVAELVDRNIENAPGVHLWVMPTSGYACTLVRARLISFRSFGRLMGLLRGPSAELRTYGAYGERFQAGRLADHLATAMAGFWPTGNAPIVLTGVSDAELTLVKLALQQRGADPDELARFRAYNGSLSKLRVPGAFNANEYIASPANYDGHAHVANVRRSLDVAGVAPRDPEPLTGGQASLALRRFRRMALPLMRPCAA